MGAPLAAKRSDAEFKLLDIADYSLPLLDEALPPAVTPKEHTTGVGQTDRLPLPTLPASSGQPTTLAILPAYTRPVTPSNTH